MMEDLFNHFIQIHSILSIIVVWEYSSAQSPNVMDCRFGRSIHDNIQYQFFIPIHSILSIIVVWEYSNAQSPNVMDCRFGRSNHYNIQYHIYIPRITNELSKKLHDSLPIVPI